MFRFGASAVAGRPPLQRLHDIARNIPDQELGHDEVLSHDSASAHAARPDRRLRREESQTLRATVLKLQLKGTPTGCGER